MQVQDKTNVEAVSTINYQFTAIPTNFIYLMDNDCFKLFVILLQKETYWNNKGMLKDGYFIKSITELSEELNLKNRKDVHTIIEALYRKELITVIVQPRKYNTARFKLNWNKINEYLNKSIYDLMEFEERIIKLNRNVTITYTNNDTDNVTNNVTNNDTKCNTTIDNINNIDNKNNINKKENIYNKNNINIYTSNIIEKNKEIEVVETSISEIEEIENNLKIEEVGFNDNPTSEKKEIIETIPTMTEKFRKCYEGCLSRLGDNCNNVSQLEERVNKLCAWIENHSNEYTSFEKDAMTQQIALKFQEIKETLENNIQEYNKLVQECLVKLQPVEQVKETPKETKESFLTNLKEYKETLIHQDNLEDAKQQFHMYCKLKNAQIKEFNLEAVVNDIVSELDTQITANKAFLDTFNIQDKESINFNEKTQEKGIKPYMLVHAEEEYPF